MESAEHTSTAASSAKIVLIEPDNALADAITRDLHSQMNGIHVAHAASLAAAEALFQQGNIDLVLAELHLPHSQPDALLTDMQAHAPFAAIVVYSDDIPPPQALRLMQQGAQDCLIKETLNAEMLARVVRYSLERARLLAEARQMQHQLDRVRMELNAKVQERTQDLASALEMMRRAVLAKDEFYTNITHELRTPLHAIINFSRFGMNKYDSAPPEKLHDYFEAIHRSGRRLLLLVNDILDLSKMNTDHAELERTRCHMEALIEQVVFDLSAILEVKEMGTDVQYEHSQRHLLIDQGQIYRVLQNLLSNAIKFSPEKSDIIIRVEPVSMAAPLPERIAAKPQDMLISVIDAGIGIPKNERETVFDEFVQSSKVKSGTFSRGTGLGLSICRRIVQAHGGNIWAEEAQSGGANVRFVLPVNEHEGE